MRRARIDLEENSENAAQVASKQKVAGCIKTTIHECRCQYHMPNFVFERRLRNLSDEVIPPYSVQGADTAG